MERENFSIVIVGHVDHGKSTLIGRLLYDTKSLPPDKLEEVEKITREKGIEFQFAYLMDHLKEERDKNITIDTAQTYFSTENRDYVIIDAPGHREFIKNMITGASSAEAGVIIIDAYEGIKDQTLRHTYLLNMLGIEQVIVLINKMDKVEYREDVYKRIVEEYKKYIEKYEIKSLYYIPISAYYGDNVSNRSEKMSWYDGKTFNEALDSFKKRDYKKDVEPFYMVQNVLKIKDENVVVGRLESGFLKKNDRVIILPDNIEDRIEDIREFGKDVIEEISKGSTAGLVLENPMKVKRGSIITKGNNGYRVTDRILGTIFWFGDNRLTKDKEYEFSIGTQEAKARVKDIKKVYDSDELQEKKERRDYIENLEIGEIEIELDRKIVITNYNRVRELGRFVIDENMIPQGGGLIK